MQAIQVKYDEAIRNCGPDLTIALHINVTVRQMFSDGPAEPALTPRFHFGGIPLRSQAVRPFMTADFESRASTISDSICTHMLLPKRTNVNPFLELFCPFWGETGKSVKIHLHCPGVLW